MSGLLGQIGGAMLVLCIVGLWLAVLTPSWIERRNLRTTARNATRVQRAVNVIARNQELPDEYEEEVSARRAAVLAREARRMERERQRAQRSEARREAGLPPKLQAAVRGQRVGSTLSLIALGLVIIGALQVTNRASGWLWLGCGLVVGVLGLAMRARATRVVRHQRRRLATEQTAQQVPAQQTPVYDVADDLDAEARRQAAAEDVRTDHTWTPNPLPKPLGVTRDEVVAAALAEAARIGDDSVPGLRPAAPNRAADEEQADVRQLPIVTPQADAVGASAAEAAHSRDAQPAAEAVAEEIEASLGEHDEYDWIDDRAGVDASFDSGRLDDILNRRRNVG
ncbi:hypothetical protein [Pseudoclavibacter sp. CFCC 11306]|uniref:hypothetical protein n=1 Tax=Pseudoclavibacter sp. CFCC 11306 TaxID=1564493 RepID=UPI0013018AED|nr:hypothetical protein [Pseudoclavibacter sp. CFCC 11306]KAB1657633.1 hypothetical protein F8O09_08400 [Pseudoclavibacter sp. CFCC 11306]